MGDACLNPRIRNSIQKIISLMIGDEGSSHADSCETFSANNMQSTKNSERNIGDVSVITLSDSEEEPTESSSDQQCLIDEILQKPMDSISTEESEDDSVCIIDPPPKKEVSVVSLDDSVCIVDSPSHREIIPKEKQWFCRDVTASRKALSVTAFFMHDTQNSAHSNQVRQALNSSFDSDSDKELEICQVSSTTEELDVTSPISINNEYNETSFPKRFNPVPEFIPLGRKIPTLTQTLGAKVNSSPQFISLRGKRKKTARTRVTKCISAKGKRKIQQQPKPACKKRKVQLSLPTVKSSSNQTLAPRPLRPIVIDGSNVARLHGQVGDTFSCKGIELAVDFFLKRGHTQVTVFVPKFRRHCLNRITGRTTDPEILDKLAQRQIVVYTPSRRINGRSCNSYDDRFMVQLATKNGGVIVTNDFYSDLIDESELFKETIEKRLLQFLFVGDEFMVPDDPFGKDGPSLHDFLSFPPETSSICLL